MLCGGMQRFYKCKPLSLLRQNYVIKDSFFEFILLLEGAERLIAKPLQYSNIFWERQGPTSENTVINCPFTYGGVDRKSLLLCMKKPSFLLKLQSNEEIVLNKWLCVPHLFLVHSPIIKFFFSLVWYVLYIHNIYSVLFHKTYISLKDNTFL